MLGAWHIVPLLICRVAKSLGAGGSQTWDGVLTLSLLAVRPTYFGPNHTCFIGFGRLTKRGHSLIHQRRGRPGKVPSSRSPELWDLYNLQAQEQGVSVSQDICHYRNNC